MADLIFKFFIMLPFTSSKTNREPPSALIVQPPRSFFRRVKYPVKNTSIATLSVFPVLFYVQYPYFIKFPVAPTCIRLERSIYNLSIIVRKIIVVCNSSHRDFLLTAICTSYNKLWYILVEFHQ